MLNTWEVLLSTNKVLGFCNETGLTLLFHNLFSVYLTNHLTFLNLSFIYKMKIKQIFFSQDYCKNYS